MQIVSKVKHRQQQTVIAAAENPKKSNKKTISDIVITIHEKRYAHRPDHKILKTTML